MRRMPHLSQNTVHITFCAVDPDGPVVILTTGSEVCGFKSGQGQWFFSERKNPEYDFRQKISKALGPVS